MVHLVDRLLSGFYYCLYFPTATFLFFRLCPLLTGSALGRASVMAFSSLLNTRRIMATDVAYAESMPR